MRKTNRERKKLGENGFSFTLFIAVSLVVSLSRTRLLSSAFLSHARTRERESESLSSSLSRSKVAPLKGEEGLFFPARHSLFFSFFFSFAFAFKLESTLFQKLEKETNERPCPFHAVPGRLLGVPCEWIHWSWRRKRGFFSRSTREFPVRNGSRSRLLLLDPSALSLCKFPNHKNKNREASPPCLQS